VYTRVGIVASHILGRTSTLRVSDRVIGNPIINSPNYPPSRHFHFNNDGITDRQARRARSGRTVKRRAGSSVAQEHTTRNGLISFMGLRIP
jgi:23S rRNA-/tRNA-specific pseudouridylate synthase